MREQLAGEKSDTNPALGTQEHGMMSVNHVGPRRLALLSLTLSEYYCVLMFSRGNPFPCDLRNPLEQVLRSPSSPSARSVVKVKS